MKKIILIAAIFAPLKAFADAPAFQATTLQGDAVPIAGKAVYLKFWATWCRYCLEEMPLLQQQADTPYPHLQVISVNFGYNENLNAVKEFLANHHYTFPTVFDGDGKLRAQYQVYGTPMHIVLDAKGNELYRGALYSDELQALLKTFQ